MSCAYVKTSHSKIFKSLEKPMQKNKAKGLIQENENQSSKRDLDEFAHPVGWKDEVPDILDDKEIIIIQTPIADENCESCTI